MHVPESQNRCQLGRPQGDVDGDRVLHCRTLDSRPSTPHLSAMLLRSVRSRLNGFIEPCLPSAADRPPKVPDWIHEIKHDGFPPDGASRRR